MKIGIVGDVHWSETSSIVRQRGRLFSARIENCIASINWAEKLFKENCCDMIVYLGDFFDQAKLSAEEITALSRIEWSDIPKKLIVGNHEISRSDLSFSTAHLFSLIPDVEVIDNITVDNESKIAYFPYILDYSSINFSNYNLNDFLVFSHNDIKGISLGNFVSKSGIDLGEISTGCKYFINGHLHNGGWINDVILNVGILTGQNFGEDAERYSHNVYIYDDGKISAYENPYAFNFYKISNIKKFNFSTIKKNAVVTIKCSYDDYTKYKDVVDGSCFCSKFIITHDDFQTSSTEKETETITKYDHINDLKDFLIQRLGNNDIVLAELQEVCR